VTPPTVVTRAWHLIVVVPLLIIAVSAPQHVIECIPLLYIALVTPTLVSWDVRCRRLPNRLVLPAIIVGIACIGLGWVMTRSPPVAPLVAGGGIALFLLIVHVTGGMGMGDVKLGLALGLAAWTPLIGVAAPVIAFLAGGAVSAVHLARKGRGGTIAFGPFLLLGFWSAVAIAGLARLLPA
jgi:leader peptidase (prepilin peptidase)/N-methyltransferase